MAENLATQWRLTLLPIKVLLKCARACRGQEYKYVYTEYMDQSNEDYFVSELLFMVAYIIHYTVPIITHDGLDFTWINRHYVSAVKILF